MKRYSLQETFEGIQMLEDAEGEWVKFEDVQEKSKPKDYLQQSLNQNPLYSDPYR